MKVVIVGSGLTGLYAAYSCLEQGHNVTLIERSASPGGVVSDHLREEGYWFRNCHYARTESNWFRHICTNFEESFFSFDHCYGSINDLFGTTVIRDDFAQPTVKHLKASKLEPCRYTPSVRGRLLCYGQPVSTALIEWSKRFGDPDLLSERNCYQMQIGRVFFADDLRNSIQAKRESMLANELYGVPRQYLNASGKAELASLPKEGWSSFIASFVAFLKHHGCTVIERQIARLEKVGERYSVSLKGEVIDSDHIIWCSDPVKLLKNELVHSASSPILHVVNILIEMDSFGLNTKPMYWQVFKQTCGIVRVYSYVAQAKHRLTVECLGKPPSLRAIEHLMHELGLNGSFRVAGQVQERRSSLVTISDEAAIDKLNRLLIDSNVTHSGWHLYGRDERIDFVISDLRGKGVLK